MSNSPEFHPDIVSFLDGLDQQMDKHFELPEPTHEDARERLNVLNMYFGTERRKMIALYLNDRTNAYNANELQEQEENYRALFENTVAIILKLRDPIYTTVDDIPVGKDTTFLVLLHMADLSQNDLNILEHDQPLQLHVQDIREKIMTAMEFPEEHRAERINRLFDTYIWSTVQRFLEFGEGRA